jgi:hypothetical protein
MTFFVCGKCYLFGEFLGGKLEKTWNSFVFNVKCVLFQQKIGRKETLVPM